MKRSQINAAIRQFESLLKEYRVSVPPFVSYSPEEWNEKGHEYDEIRERELGWDVTDYGLGDYEHTGLALITMRNGSSRDQKYARIYTEKLMMLLDGQTVPTHFHWYKTEDMINRGGGKVILRVWNSTENEQLSPVNVRITRDGLHYSVPAGSQIVLSPGESITMYPGYYHTISAMAGEGPVLIGEVSAGNDDDTDNRFLEDVVRFPLIEEDEPPYRLLCHEYPPARKKAG